MKAFTAYSTSTPPSASSRNPIDTSKKGFTRFGNSIFPFIYLLQLIAIHLCLEIIFFSLVFLVFLGRINCIFFFLICFSFWKVFSHFVTICEKVKFVKWRNWWVSLLGLFVLWFFFQAVISFYKFSFHSTSDPTSSIRKTTNLNPKMRFIDDANAITILIWFIFIFLLCFRLLDDFFLLRLGHICVCWCISKFCFLSRAIFVFFDEFNWESLCVGLVRKKRLRCSLNWMLTRMNERTLMS